MSPQDPQSLDDLVSQLVNNQRTSNSSPPPQPKPAPAVIPSPSSPPQNLPGTSTDSPRTGLGKESQPLRTMQSDLDLLKKSPSSGPTLSQLPKIDRPSVTPTPKPPVPPMPERTPMPPTQHPVQPSPKSPTTPPPVFKAPAPYAPPVIRPPVKPEPPKPPVQVQQKPSFSIPSGPSSGQPTKKMSKIILFVLLGALAAMGIGVYFYISNQSGQVIPTPTPTPVATPTPTPSLFEVKFGKAEIITIPIQGHPAFLEALKPRLVSNVNQGQFKAYKVVESNGAYQLGTFLSETGAFLSAPLSEELYTTEWVLVLMGHSSETGQSITRPFIAAKLTNSIDTNQLLSDWAKQGLAALFAYDQNSAKNAKLVTDSYKNIQFRYAKIPNKDFGVAYAVFEGYLVIASSRDSFRAAVDALAVPPGK